MMSTSGVPSAAFVGAMLVLGASSAVAQGLRIEPRVNVTVTASDNGNLGVLGDEPAIIQLLVAPSVQLRANTARLRVDGTVGLESTTNIRSTREDRVYPTGYLNASADLVDRWLYIDTAASVERSANDLFVPQGLQQWISVGQTVYQTRISPYLSHEFSPRLSIKGRSDNVWTRRRSDSELGVSSSETRSRRDTASIDVKPEPFGVLAEATDENAGDDAASGASALDLRSARVIVSYAPTNAFVFGISSGRERSEFLNTAAVDSTVGARARYTPNERTRVDAEIERRFFGWGGSLGMLLRSPFVALEVQAQRRPVVQASPLLYATAGQSLLSLLDAAFATRYPDASQRSVVVDNFVKTYGLPDTASGAIDVFPDYPQLQSRGSVRLILFGRVTTASVGVFADRSTLLARDGDPYLVTPVADADSRQMGGSFDLARRVSPVLVLRLGASGRQAVGLGVQANSYAREVRYTSGFTYTANPQTEFSGGGFVRRYRSDLVPRDREIAVFGGVTYRF